MGKQILIVALWGYSWWYLGAMIAVELELPELIGPLLGVAGAAFIARFFTWSVPGRARKVDVPSEPMAALTTPRTTTAR